MFIWFYCKNIVGFFLSNLADQASFICSENEEEKEKLAVPKPIKLVKKFSVYS